MLMPCFCKVLEKGKQSSLDKQKKGSKEQARWHEELASESEAFVCLFHQPVSLSGMLI
jgi:hypothetical protein